MTTAAATTTNMDEMLTEMGKRARAASRALAVLPPAVKNAALGAMASAFEAHRADIRAENAK
ncbi:gamma-glutamyl-phosphate reductase, partial [Candidatus Sumerlaeota bacterium]|nr:gamma-glutamyl-phosphate reductase [Candidatus Sumerlaeota bacterium]